MNKRIWIYWNDSKSKITLSQDKPVHLYKSGRTDEGWNSVSERYLLEDGEVSLEIVTDGRDCDGRLSTFHSYQLMGDEWIKQSSSQRDYSAEAMGY